MVSINKFKLEYISSENNAADFFTKIMNKQRHEYLVSLIIRKEKVLQRQYICPVSVSMEFGRFFRIMSTVSPSIMMSEWFFMV